MLKYSAAESSNLDGASMNSILSKREELDELHRSNELLKKNLSPNLKFKLNQESDRQSRGLGFERQGSE